jgi:hypothetical protein
MKKGPERRVKEIFDDERGIVVEVIEQKAERDGIVLREHELTQDASVHRAVAACSKVPHTSFVSLLAGPCSEPFANMAENTLDPAARTSRWNSKR